MSKDLIEQKLNWAPTPHPPNLENRPIPISQSRNPNESVFSGPSSIWEKEVRWRYFSRFRLSVLPIHDYSSFRSMIRELESLRSLLARVNFGTIPRPELGRESYPCTVHLFPLSLAIMVVAAWAHGSHPEVFFFSFCIVIAFQFPI